jgi:hypothetical protein
MATHTNSKPARAAAPVVVRRSDENMDRGGSVWLLVAVLLSVVFHVGLFGLMLLLSSPSNAAPPMESNPTDATVQEQPKEEAKSVDPLVTTDIDPAAQAPQQDINFNNDRKAEISVPGMNNPNDPIGIEGADLKAPPTNLPAPSGFGNAGQGGAIESPFGNALSGAAGMSGGYLKGMALAGGFGGRSGASRQKALVEGGGTKERSCADCNGSSATRPRTDAG